MVVNRATFPDFHAGHAASGGVVRQGAAAPNQGAMGRGLGASSEPGLKVRPYQESVLQELERLYRVAPKNCLLAPTGAGKTYMMREFVRRGGYRRILFVCHRDVLAEQAGQDFASLGVPIGYITGTRTENRDRPLQIASVQSLASRDWWLTESWDLVLYDEVHRTVGFTSAMAALSLDAHHLGVTATPWRKGDQLGDLFADFAGAPLTAELESMGYLVPMEAYRIEGAHTEALVASRSESGFTDDSLKVAFNTPDSIRAAFEGWAAICPGVRSIGFGVSIDHCKNLVAEWRSHGYQAAAITSDVFNSYASRRPFFQALGEGRIHALFTVDALSEGFNVPEVECVMSLGATKSRSRARQQFGRGARISPHTGKVKCFLLDQAGNVIGPSGHGLSSWDEEWDWPKAEAKRSRGEQLPPMKFCDKCQRLNHVSARVCVGCGAAFEIRPVEKDDAVGVFVLITDADRHLSDRTPAKDFRKMRSAYARMAKSAYSDSASPFRAVEQFRAEFGFEPDGSVTRGAIFGSLELDAALGAYRPHLKMAKAMGAEFDELAALELEFGPLSERSANASTH